MNKYKFIEDFKTEYRELRIIDRIMFIIVSISIPILFIGLFLNIEIFEIIGISFGFSFSLLLLISSYITNNEKKSIKEFDNPIKYHVRESEGK